MKNKTQKLFQSIKEEIEIKSKKHKLVGHSGEIGESREKLVEKFLIDLMPKIFGYGHGKIIDANGKESNQQDIIIFSQYSSILSEDSKLYPIDAVLSTIEIKSYLNKSELKKALKNIESAKKLKSIDGKFISCNIFAYDGDSKETIFKNLKSLKKELKLKDEKMFDNLCVNGKFLLSKNNKIRKLALQKINFDYLMLNIQEKALPYFLDSILSEMEMPKTIPIFTKYLGKFKMKIEEWNIK